MNDENLRPAPPFSKKNQPARRGRKKGSRNRSTLLKEWLSTVVNVRNPVTGQTESREMEHEITLALIAKARKGDIRAIQEINDTLYGKIPNTINLNVDELDTEIERRLAGLASRSESTLTGEAESESVN